MIKGFDDDLNILIVSDSINTISICLTKDAIDDFKKKNPRATLSSLKGSIIKMEKWHFSSLFHVKLPSKWIHFLPRRTVLKLTVVCMVSLGH